MALRMADQILLVAQLELASLRNVVRLIHCLSGEENLAERSAWSSTGRARTRSRRGSA